MKKSSIKSNPTNQTIHKIKLFLKKEDTTWYPVPALLAFGLVLLLSGHLMPSLNPRLGNQSEVTSSSHETDKEGAIWISIYPKNESIHIETSDRFSFKYSSDLEEPKEMEDFISYLKKKTLQTALSSSLSLKAYKINHKVTISVDKNMTYGKFRPILYAMAKADISNYVFETKLVK